MYRLILSGRNSGGSSPRGPSVQWLYVIQVGSFPFPDGLQPVLRIRCVGNPRLLQMAEKLPGNSHSEGYGLKPYVIAAQ